MTVWTWALACQKRLEDPKRYQRQHSARFPSPQFCLKSLVESPLWEVPLHEFFRGTILLPQRHSQKDEQFPKAIIANVCIDSSAEELFRDCTNIPKHGSGTSEGWQSVSRHLSVCRRCSHGLVWIKSSPSRRMQISANSNFPYGAQGFHS